MAQGVIPLPQYDRIGPLPSLIRMNHTSCLLTLLALSWMLLPGCRTPTREPVPSSQTATNDTLLQDDGERDAVLAALQHMKQDALRQAFAGLPNYRYTLYTRTEQFDDTHHRTAFAEHVRHIDRRDGGRTYTVLQADSGGTFNSSALGRFMTSGAEMPEATTLADYVLLEDPPYLAARNRDAFAYRFRADTLLGGLATQVIEVYARPNEEGKAQSIRRAHLYLDRDRDELVALYLERVEGSLLFGEASRLYLRIRPAPGGGWVPYQVQIRTHLRLPFRTPQRFRTLSTYYNYEPIS